MLVNSMCIAVGASLGALLRYMVSVACNPLLSGIPLGTLICNVIGGYAAGFATQIFLFRPDLEVLRPFFITGFLGALTTFSTFSLEVVRFLQEDRYGAALFCACVHLVGTVSATVAGFASAKCVRLWF